MKDVFILFCDMLFPFAMVIIGCIWIRKPVERINYASGYRTKRSMQSQKAWEIAQEVFAKESIRFGIFSALISVMILVVGVGLMDYNITQLTPVLLVIQTLLYVATYIPVESRLKKLD